MIRFWYVVAGVAEKRSKEPRKLAEKRGDYCCIRTATSSGLEKKTPWTVGQGD